MMLRSLFAALLLAAPAFAQTPDNTIETGTGRSMIVATPLAVHGQGVVMTDVQGSTVATPGVFAPNSEAWPDPAPSVITFRVQPVPGAVGVYVCWQGGFCQPYWGELIAPGESVTRALPTPVTAPPTLWSEGYTAVTVVW